MDQRFAPSQLSKGGRRIVKGDAARCLAFHQPHHAEPGAADPRGIFEQLPEDRVQFACRRADDLQHVGGCGLMLQRFAQVGGFRLHLFEQAGVLDGDHRLVGEGLHQIDLALGERAGLRSRQYQHAFDIVVPEHRHAKRPANSVQGALGHFHFRVRKDIGYDFDLPRCDDARGGRTAAGPRRVCCPIMQEFGGGAGSRSQRKHVAFAKEDRTAIGAAQFDRGLDQRFENALEIESRTTDDLEHVGGRGLLRNQLIEPALQISNDLLGNNVVGHNEFSKISGKTPGSSSGLAPDISKHDGPASARGSRASIDRIASPPRVTRGAP